MDERLYSEAAKCLADVKEGAVDLLDQLKVGRMCVPWGGESLAHRLRSVICP
jgi:hypothetical protein